jgi:hypothetical protein
MMGLADVGIPVAVSVAVSVAMSVVAVVDEVKMIYIKWLAFILCTRTNARFL